MKENVAPRSIKLGILLPSLAAAVLLNPTELQAQNNLLWTGASANWDVTSLNWTAADVLTNYNQGDNVTFAAPATSYSPNLTTVLTPASVTVSGASNFTFTGTGKLSGSTGITKSGGGLLTISTANDFSGQVLINDGILKAGNTSALGSNEGSTVISGGTLDVGAQNLSTEPIIVQGTGAGGTNGAINNTSGQQQSALRFVTLSGDTMFNASNGRWDINGSTNGYFAGGGFTLTKIGGQAIFLNNVGDTGLGNIVVSNNILGFQSNITMGDPNKTATVLGPTGEIRFFSTLTNQNKQLILTNGGIFSATGGSNNFVGPITLAGPALNTINVNNANVVINIMGPISGSGGFQKGNAQKLYLSGTNSYTGPTILNSGTIVLGPNAVFGPSSIQLASGTTFDASSTGLTLGDGQTLSGRGTVIGAVNSGANSIISPGTTTVASTLTINGDVAVSNATFTIKLSSDASTIGNNVNDLVLINGNFTAAGNSTIQIAPTGPLSSGQPYVIAQYSGTFTGSSANFHVVSSNPRYAFTVVDPATTAPYLQVIATGVPGSLVWRGNNASNPTAWDHSTTNWFNSAISAADLFFNGDTATFDDSALTNFVSIIGTNSAGLISMANNSVPFTFGGDGLLAGTLQMSGTGDLTLAMSNAPALSSIANDSGTLIFALAGSNHIVSTVITDNGSGTGSIVKSGTNILTLSGTNTFSGNLQINSGILKTANASALGSPSGKTTVASGATLDVNAMNLGSEPIEIQGAGVGGTNGAIDNSSTAAQQQAFTTVTLLGDTTFNASAGRWDIGNNGVPGAIFNGNGFNLTKVGPQVVIIKDAGDTALGDIHVVAGRLGFQGAVGLGDPTKKVTVESNAVLTIYQAFGPDVVAKELLLNGSAALDCGGGPNSWGGTVTLVGTNTFAMRSDLHMQNSINGAGGLIATVNGPVGNGNGILYLEGANTYNGPTIIRANSQIVVGGNSSLGSSSLIELDNGSTLDVSALASFDLSAGQLLLGNGTIVGGNINFGNGSALVVGFPGSTPNTLTINGNLTFQSGSSNLFKLDPTGGASDSMVGLGSVTFGGTLVLSNLTGAPFVAGNSYQLFSAGSYSGAFDSIVPASPGNGLLWDTNNLASSGVLGVISAAQFTGASVQADGSFQLTFTGVVGQQYTLLGSTNIALPLNQWTPISSGSISSSPFAVSDTTATNYPQRFYILSVQ